MYLLSFLAPCLGRVLWVWQCLFYISYTLLGHILGTSAMFDSIVHDVYIYLYMLVYGWFCTLYDRPSWLREQPSLAISALDLVVWVYAQGSCCRCIFMLYCVHNHCDVTVLIHVTKWHWFPRVCDVHTLRGSSSSKHKHFGTRCIRRHETLPVRHQTRNFADFHH